MPLPNAKMIRCLTGALVSAALCLPLMARAQTWGFMDEQGYFHFADSALDQRYLLMFGGTLDAGGVRALVQTQRSLTYFDLSVSYKAVRPYLRQAAQAHAVDYELLKAVVATESGFNPRAVSPKGAVGLMQLMPSTAAFIGVKSLPGKTLEESLSDPRTNIEAGARYLARQMQRFDGRVELALAAYNAGAGAVLKAGRQVPDYPETQRYVRKVLGLYEQLKPVQHSAAPEFHF